MLSGLTSLFSSCWGGQQDEDEGEEHHQSLLPQNGPPPSLKMESPRSSLPPSLGSGTGKDMSEVFSHFAEPSQTPSVKSTEPPPVSQSTGEQPSGEKAKEIEKMITLYHISNAPKWVDGIDKGKQEGKSFDKLAQPIDPFLTQNRRIESAKKGDYFGGDGRGGDDLGPGFYTGDSPSFVDKYLKDNFSGPTDMASVLQFQLPEKALESLKVQRNGKDDEGTFQKYMSEGFPTQDTKTGKVSSPKLDEGLPPQDLLTGPINDIHNSKYAEKDGVKHTEGSILKLGEETPTQYNWSSQKGVEALYNQSQISSFKKEDWIEMRKKQEGSK